MFAGFCGTGELFWWFCGFGLGNVQFTLSSNIHVIKADHGIQIFLFSVLPKLYKILLLLKFVVEMLSLHGFEVTF